MGNQHLSLKPHRVGDDGCWWYEEPEGITVVVEHRTKQGIFCKTKQYKIRWSAIRHALARKDKKP